MLVVRQSRSTLTPFREDAMKAGNLTKSIAAVIMLGAAGLFFWRFVRSEESGVSDQAFFYDLSEKKLFTAPRTSVPPIRGLNDNEEDGVRAIVVSTTGNPRDKTSWKIAYLERYSPELKRQMEAAQTTASSPQMSRIQAQGHRFVRRLADNEWFPMSSAEAEQIVSEWTVPASGANSPVVCTP